MRAPIAASLLALAACAEPPAPEAAQACAVEIVVLGVAQDGGKPQIARHDDPAWRDPAQRRLATSLGLVDRRTTPARRFLFEATPDLREQLKRLDDAAPRDTLGIDGVFLTHAHIGHYAGLMFLGHESAGAANVIVHVMPRMASFLENNGPWSQLVRYQNILLAIMAANEAETIGDALSVTPVLVPHRQEFSEVVAFRIDGPARSALFLPDIDRWEDWDREGMRVEDVIASVDIAFLDATFYADGEIPGRDMSGFPHPFVETTMARLAALPDAERAKVRFIHMNHTNPLHDPAGEARRRVEAAGFGVADEGERICLS